jgi:hypothetical protein
MKRPKPSPQPNYLRKLLYLRKIGALPHDVGVHQISVYHNDFCGHWQQQRCNCDPDIKLKWSQPTAAQN